MFGIQFLNGLGTSQQFGDAVWALRHNFFIIHGNTVYRGIIGRRFDGIKIWIPLGLWRWPWQPRHRRWSVATGGSARDVTHSITSIIQSFVNKCNNSNSCKLFYLDYKSANSQITSNAIQGASFRLAGLSAGKYCLFCIQHIYFVMSDGPCWETKY